MVSREGIEPKEGAALPAVRLQLADDQRDRWHERVWI